MQKPLAHVRTEQFNHLPIMVRRLGHRTRNSWEEEQKATALVIALRSAALEILEALSDEGISKYSALTTALELRFGDEHLK